MPLSRIKLIQSKFKLKNYKMGELYIYLDVEFYKTYNEHGKECRARPLEKYCTAMVKNFE